MSPSNPHAVVVAALSHLSGLYDVVAFCTFRYKDVLRDCIVPPMVKSAAEDSGPRTGVLGEDAEACR